MTWPTKNLGTMDLRTLVLAKAMYSQGCNFARRKDEISRMLAIHTFDNVAEMILKLLARVKNISPQKTKDRWGFYDLLKEAYGEGAFKDQIDALHHQRNQVHHAGDIPSAETIIKYQTHSEDFIKDICQKELDVSYEELSLAFLIMNIELRELFKKVEQSFGEEKYIESIDRSEEVFCEAVFNTADIFSKAGILTGYFKGGDELGEIIKDTYAEKYKNSDHYGFAKEVSKAFLQLGMSTTAMQFLGEYRIDFLRHRKRVENIDQIPNEKLKSEAQESLNFILNIILKWQEEKIL